MAAATITSKGQVTLPSEVRKRLNLKPGDRIDFVFSSNGQLIVKTQKEPFERLAGIVKSPHDHPLTLEEIDESIAQYHAEEDARIRRQYAGKKK